MNNWIIKSNQTWNAVTCWKCQLTTHGLADSQFTRVDPWQAWLFGVATGRESQKEAGIWERGKNARECEIETGKVKKRLPGNAKKRLEKSWKKERKKLLKSKQKSFKKSKGKNEKLNNNINSKEKSQKKKNRGKNKTLEKFEGLNFYNSIESIE